MPTYDSSNGNGNLTFDGTSNFGYDAENRLTSAVGAGNTASYTYDAQGRRKTRIVNGTTTVFVTDAGNREVLEYDGSSGAIQRWYAYGIGSNDVLNQTNVVAGTRTAFIPDIRGSVIASLDSTTATLTKISYLPYGKSANAAAPFGYTGQRIDAETNGLYYYRARHYSPAWGRFMQSDPIGYSGGINLYAYVNDDPLNFTDPNGLAKDAVVAAVGASAAPELAQSQAVTDFVQQHPQAAMVEGGIGIVATVGAPLAVAAAGLLGTGGVVVRSIGEIGAAGEEAVGIAANVPKVAIRIPESATIRHPDILTQTTIGEVKNVAKLSFTQQLQDYLAFAQSTGRTFNLYTRPTTNLTGPLQQAISSGQINLKFIPQP